MRFEEHPAAADVVAPRPENTAPKPRHYHSRAQDKLDEQKSRIPEEWRLSSVPAVEAAPNALEYIRESSLLTQEELVITETANINALLERIATKQLTSVQVTKAFCKRAAIAHQLTTCCTEILFDRALEDAQKLDDYLARTGETVGPLHGLPISVKDTVDIAGLDTSLGWVGLTNKPAKRDSGTAALLKRLGAVLYVKTNIPQSLMMSDSYNHVFGQCVHPTNRNLISGGSSGGESSLISTRGSILGVGTDVGGSIRIPASLCGIYGLSPTSLRHPYERGGLKQRIILSTAGPMATSLSSIEKYMQVLPEGKPWELDNLVTPMPWRSELCSIQPPGRKLKIGFILDDGVVKPQPPITHAVQTVIESLKAAGHDVFEWDATSHGYAYDLWKKAILSDGGAGCKRLCDLSGEPLVEGMLVGQAGDLLTTEETHQLTADIETYKSEYLRRWNDCQVDAIITPVTPWVGYKPWTWVKSHQYVGYTTLSNLLDWPGLVMPVTTASKSGDSSLPPDWVSHKPRNKADEFNKNQYDIDLVEGIPVGIQIMAGRYGEEKSIAVAKIIEEVLQ